MNLTKLVCAGVLAAAMAAPSFAADLPRPVYKAPIYVAPFSWTGFYIGVNGGYAWGHADWNNVNTSLSHNVDGALVGGTIGYNLQTGAFVFGLEADLDATWIDGSNVGGAPGTVCSGPTGCSVKNSWLATGRGRIGYAWDRWLPFITGGAAYGDVKMTQNSGGFQTEDRLGWTLGAGVEYAFLGAWSAKAEYLYVDLGTATCEPAVCGPSTDVHFKTNMVRLGVNYRF
jgi:outer membrane immunogenic protein